MTPYILYYHNSYTTLVYEVMQDFHHKQYEGDYTPPNSDGRGEEPLLRLLSAR